MVNMGRSLHCLAVSATSKAKPLACHHVDMVVQLLNHKQVICRKASSCLPGGCFEIHYLLMNTVSRRDDGYQNYNESSQTLIYRRYIWNRYHHAKLCC